jgi:uncharacterized protein (TIGR02284 family)
MTAANKKEPVAILNDLIAYCKDTEKGFSEASRDVRDEEYQKMFTGYAARMKEFAASLQEQVVKLGGKPRQEGGMSGEIRRVWMHFRSALNLHHTGPVLLECEKEEESLLDHYENAVKSGLTPAINDVVERQYVEIIEIRNRLKDLELGAKPNVPAEKKLTP